MAPGCGGAGGAARGPDLRTMKDRPPVAVVVREGDPSAALAVAVFTGAIAPERGAEVAAALAALTESRLRSSDFGVVPAWDGYRIRALVGPQPDSASALVEAVQRALATPVVASELPAIKRKLDALATRRIADVSLVDVTRCRGEAFGLPRPAPAPTLAEVEGWRRAAHGLGRVAVAAVGSSQTTDAIAAAVARGAAWSPGAPFAASEPAPTSDAPSVYDASGELAPGEARAVLAFHVPRAEQAVAVAPVLADPRGPLVSRLRALEATKEAPKVKELVATAHARGGCLSVTLDFRDLGSEPATRIATAVALARQEVTAELGDAVVSDDAKAWDTGLALARRAGDPREAAERAAWWTLVRPAADPVVRVAVAVGITNGRDAPPRGATEAIAARSSAAASLAPLRQEIERAVAATSAPVVEGKIKVEKGQSDLWVLFASPCGTLPEVDLDAGLGAAFAFTAVEEARARTDARIEIEPFTAADGIGVLAHGAAIPGEPPTALARRVADAAARSFAADPIDPVAASRARAALLAQASESVDGRSLVALANAVAPGHPSWFLPTGTFDALGRSSDATLFTRSAALRAGALRVGVIANTDLAQATAAVRAIAGSPGAGARAAPAGYRARLRLPAPAPTRSTRPATRARRGSRSRWRLPRSRRLPRPTKPRARSRRGPLRCSTARMACSRVRSGPRPLPEHGARRSSGPRAPPRSSYGSRRAKRRSTRRSRRRARSSGGFKKVRSTRGIARARSRSASAPISSARSIRARASSAYGAASPRHHPHHPRSRRSVRSPARC
jgi:hypothetical protein